MGGLKSEWCAEFKRRLQETLGKLRENSEDLLKVFDEAPQTEAYRKGRSFVRTRLRNVHTSRTVDVLITEAWDSKWARFYNFMAIRSRSRARVLCLILGSTLVLILIAFYIWKCVSRRRARKKDENA